MKRTQRTALAALITVISCLPAPAAQTTTAHDGKAARSEHRASAGTHDAAANEAAVKALLEEFLSKVDDPTMHERFWADDLIYVGATGKKRTKQEILDSFKKTEEPDSQGEKRMTPVTTYSAEDEHVRAFGEVVVVNFRLVQHVGDTTPKYFRNSGTFVKRNGKWQAVSWQATAEQDQPPLSTTSK